MESDPSEVRAVRLARNEAMFREVNERIEKVTERFATSAPMAFVCECVDSTCARHIELTRDEYEALRSDAKRFAVSPGHDDPELENVVDRRSGYVVVEKVGAGARVATATDPRSGDG